MHTDTQFKIVHITSQKWHAGKPFVSSPFACQTDAVLDLCLCLFASLRVCICECVKTDATDQLECGHMQTCRGTKCHLAQGGMRLRQK